MLGGTIYTRSTSQNNLDERSRDISPKKDVCGDALWSKYLAQTNDEKGATTLRSDASFLENLLKVL